MSSLEKPVSAAELLAVSGLALATIAVVGWRIGYPALLLDEHTSLAFTQESWSDLFGRLWAADTHRPIFYALLKAWIGVAGMDLATMRMLGALFAAASVVVVWAIGRVLGGRDVALMAAALSVCSPMFIAQARELRMYPLFTFALLLAVLALALILCKGGTNRRWLGLAAAAAAAFYAHSIGLLFFPLAGALVLGLCLAGLAPRRLIFGLAGSALLWLVLISPGLQPMLFHSRATLADFWIPHPSLGWVWSQMAGAYPYPTLSKPLIMLALLGGLAAAWQQDRRVFWILLTMTFATPLMLWGGSYLRPVLIVRVFVWTTLIGGIVLAFALCTLRPAWRWPGLGILVALQLLALRPFYPSEPQQTWIDRMGPELQAFDLQQDVLVLGLVSFEDNLRWNHPELRDADMRAFSHGDRRVPYAAVLWSDHLDRDQAASMSLGHGQVWIIWEIEPTIPVPVADRVEPALKMIRARTRPVRQEVYGPLLLEVRTPEAPPG